MKSQFTRRQFHLFLALPLLSQVKILSGAAAMPRLHEGNLSTVLSGYKGKVVLFNYWATWCAPCLEEMPLLVEIYRKHQAKGFQLVTVSCDEPEEESRARALVEKHGVPAPAYLKSSRDDDKFINLVNTKWSGALPALFLYDRQGKLARSFIGETEMSAVDAAIRKLL
jgi:thiol-disulfide isomerase/thioredoxin